MKIPFKKSTSIAVGAAFTLALVQPTLAKTVNLFPRSGSDATSGSAAELSATAIGQLRSSDDNRLTLASAWPETYDEARYLEVNFSKQPLTSKIPPRAQVKSVKLIIEHKTSPVSPDEVKVEIWDGTNWSHQTVLANPTPEIDSFQSIDITPYINRSGLINTLRVRVLGQSPVATQSAIDRMRVKVVYSKKGSQSPKKKVSSSKKKSSSDKKSSSSKPKPKPSTKTKTS